MLPCVLRQGLWNLSCNSSSMIHSSCCSLVASIHISKTPGWILLIPSKNDCYYVFPKCNSARTLFPTFSRNFKLAVSNVLYFLGSFGLFSFPISYCMHFTVTRKPCYGHCSNFQKMIITTLSIASQHFIEFDILVFNIFNFLTLLKLIFPLGTFEARILLPVRLGSQANQ